MNSITFTCETITPMFLSGADGTTPELRAPSIKGALRFWWRALHGHLPLGDLKKREGEIFGDNNHKSKFTLFVKELNLKIGKAAPTPHRSFEISCIKEGSTFQVTLNIPVETPQWNMEKCKLLFELTCILGDFGKRARRGMGSVDIIACSDPKWEKKTITITHIHQLLQAFNPFYVLRNGAIYHSYSGSMQYYPWIRQIQLGEPKSNLLMDISRTTHNVKALSSATYEASLGHAKGGRFASPVYVTVVKGSLRPLITSLNTIPDREGQYISLRLQDEFKNSILK